ncbi:hypothetical protein ACNQFZ_06635 [Schinkia sp. CFF1]
MEVGITSDVEPMMLKHEVGGLVAEAVKIVLGNPDVIVTMIGFAFFITLCLVIIEVYQKFR